MTSETTDVGPMGTTEAPEITLDGAIALMQSGRHAVAAEQFADLALEPDADRPVIYAYLAEASLLLGRPHEARVWCEQLRCVAARPDQADLQEALACVRIGDGTRAVELLDRVVDPDTEHHRYPTGVRHAIRAQALQLAGRYEDAAAELAVALAEDPRQRDCWKLLATLCAVSEIDPGPLLDHIPEDAYLEVLVWLTEASRAGVDRIAEHLWQRKRGDVRVMFLIAHIGAELTAERALEWSARMRETGLDLDCPLLGIAAHPGHRPEHRVRAACIAYAAFGDERARALVELTVTFVPDEQLGTMLDELIEVAPDLSDSFVASAANTSRRAILLAAHLCGLGIEPIAVAVAAHGLTLHREPLDLLVRSVVATSGHAALDRLVDAARRHGADDVAALGTLRVG